MQIELEHNNPAYCQPKAIQHKRPLAWQQYNREIDQFEKQILLDILKNCSLHRQGRICSLIFFRGLRDNGI